MSGLDAIATVGLSGGVFALGDAALRAFGLRRSNGGVAWFGWAAATGLLLSGVAVVATLVVGAPRPFATAGVALLVALLVFERVARRRRAAAPSTVVDSGNARNAGARAWERVAFGIVVGLVALAAVDRAILVRGIPVANDDELFIWEVRGRALLEAGAIDATFGAMVTETIPTEIGPHRRVRHPDYPLLLPSLAAAIHAASGGVGGVDVRLPAHLVNVALVFALAGALARRLRPGAAALALIAVAGGRAAVADGWFMGDSFVALGLLVALDAIDRSRSDPRVGYAFLAATGVGLAAFAKNEGMLAAVAIVCGSWVASGRPTRWAPLIAALLFCGFNVAVNAALGLKNDHMGDNAEGELVFETAWRLRGERPAAVFALVAQNVVFAFEGSGGAFFAAFGLALLRPRTSGDRGPFATAACLMFLGFTFVYVGTHSDLAWHWATSGLRVYGQIVPAAAVWAASSAAAILPRLRPI